MKRTFLLAAAASIGITTFGQVQCGLNVRVADPFGIETRQGYFSVSGNPERFETGKDQILPCGNVALRLEVPGFRPEHLSLTTLPGLQFQTVGMRPAQIEDVGDSGRITNVTVLNFDEFRDCNRLRIMPIFRPQAVIETHVSHRGGAGILQMDPGTYSFVLTGKAGVCGFVLTTIDGLSPIRVRLTSFHEQ